MILTMVEHVLVVNIGQHGQWSKTTVKREITMKYIPFEQNLLPATDIIPGQKSQY